MMTWFFSLFLALNEQKLVYSGRMLQDHLKVSMPNVLVHHARKTTSSLGLVRTLLIFSLRASFSFPISFLPFPTFLFSYPRRIDTCLRLMPVSEYGPRLPFPWHTHARTHMHAHAHTPSKSVSHLLPPSSLSPV